MFVMESRGKKSDVLPTGLVVELIVVPHSARGGPQRQGVVEALDTRTESSSGEKVDLGGLRCPRSPKPASMKVLYILPGASERFA